MTKKYLLLFTAASVDKGLADPPKLTRLLAEADTKAKVCWAYFDDLSYLITNDEAAVYDHRNDCPLSDYSVVYFRHWSGQEGQAIAAARICKLSGIPFVDEEVLRRGSQNKITQYVNLFEAKIPMPRTLIAHGRLLTNIYAQHGFGFPFIMKDKSGTRGQGNHLVRSEAAMQAIIAANPEVTYVLQEFIPNSGDYRVFVLGDSVKLVIERQATAGSHLNNTSQGAAASIVPLSVLPKAVLDDCVAVARLYGRNVAGVDIVRSDTDGQYYCFEVNRAPQIEHASFEQQKAALLAEYLASF